MNKPLFVVAICLLQVLSSLGEPIPDPDYTEHKVVNQDSKTSSYTDSYTNDGAGAGGNAISAYYAAPRAFYSAPRSYVSYPAYRSYPATYYPRYVSYAAPAAYADDNVYITDNYGRTTSVSKASAYRGFY